MIVMKSCGKDRAAACKFIHVFGVPDGDRTGHNVAKKLDTGGILAAR